MGTKNPQVNRAVDKEFKLKINVFCLLPNEKVEYFIYNSDKYLWITRNVVLNFLDNFPLDQTSDLFYQMVESPAHSSKEVDHQL